jgi:RNA polymerase I-specific transcription initiation factor RRN3
LGLAWRKREENEEDEKEKERFISYKEVLLGLASSIPASLPTIINGIVSSLISTKTTDANTRGIQILFALVKLAPSSSALLLPAVEFHFPYHSKGISEHVSYVQSLMALAVAMPAWRYRMLELVIGKALIIDVELQNDAELLGKMENLEKETEIETVTLTEDTAIEDFDGERLKLEESQRRKRLKSVRRGTRKLDAILQLVFAHISDFIRQPNGAPDERRSRDMFHFMLNVFERTVLPTFKSRHVQFLAFYMASLQPTLADQFLGLLFRPLVQFCQGLDNGRSATPSPNLLLSVTYIGAFVARAKFLSDELLKLAFEMLIDLSTRLLQRVVIGSPSILPILSLQHILYIFNWGQERLRDILGEEELEELFDILLEDETVLIYCQDDIVETFLHRAADLIDPDIGPSYRRARKATNWFGKSKYEDLESYFPFDPIMLPKSRQYITDEMYMSETTSEHYSPANSPEDGDYTRQDHQIESTGSGRPSL